jgi:hypothetical protein
LVPCGLLELDPSCIALGTLSTTLDRFNFPEVRSAAAQAIKAAFIIADRLSRTHGPTLPRHIVS